ncbi:ArsA family ATPase [Leptolyngbya sp. AN02str]|uniref:ArsA family ATPase n=1 Tax=Leptolyngbya sp. AN02str TaxID=3423363 RepID=UPI003D31EF41
MDQLDALTLAMVSGKGGVGKTTLSCGFARRWAHQFPGDRVLLLSTDPAHSLGDVLNILVHDTPQPMPDLPNLQVRSLDAQALLQAFKTRYGQTLELLVERGSFVQGEDLTPVWNLNWPGLDELMSLLEIQRILRDGEADRVVVDMAPSGHTLSLFRLMDFLEELLQALELFQENHRVIQRSLTGRYTPDEADATLAEMTADLHAGRHLLQDATQTACLVVAIPEPMSLMETERLLRSLAELHISCRALFVNHSLSATAADPNDEIGATRLLEQQHLLSKFQFFAGDKPVFLMPQQRIEPIGGSALDALIQQVVPLMVSPSSPAPRVTTIALPKKISPSFEDFIAAGRRLVIVGGKGGVGKTTVAGAIAWGMAQRHPEAAVRVISIDPAHSLGDALAYQLGHQPTAITANLSAQEVSATHMLDQFRNDYLWELAAMMSGETAPDDALQIAYRPEAWRRIVAQALPGIDEMLALISVMELLESGEQQLIVLDTAPTGHLLRFLEMPVALGDWLGWIFKLWIKYQDVAGRVDLMGRLRSLRQRVMQAQKKLTDPTYTEFVGVTLAQAAVAAESARLLHSLTDKGVIQRYIVHNCYEPGQNLVEPAFDALTLIRLARLPRVFPSDCRYSPAPLGQVQLAADLIFL